MTDNNYYRLMYEDTRYLSDYTINDSALNYEDTNALINDTELSVITDLKDAIKYPMYADWYSWVPDVYLSQMYQHILRTVDHGFIPFFLDNPVDGYKWGIELLVAILEAFKIRDYEQEFIDTGELHIKPKPLSRTIGSQEIGDMSLSFESERLSMRLDGPFEQFLSTVPNGIEIINKYKTFRSSINNFGVV